MLRTSAFRHVVAVGLMLVLTLVGAARGVAGASETSATGFGIPGVAVHICHTGAADGSVPADQPHHDCCESCVLLAAATVPDAPSMGGPGSIMRYVAHVQAMAWVPTIARHRTPRQSRGPPAA